MSERARVLGDVLRERLGDKAARHAPVILIELLKRRYVLFELSEVPDYRETGILVTVAAELEEDAAAAATWMAMQVERGQTRAAAREDATPPHTKERADA